MSEIVASKVCLFTVLGLKFSPDRSLVHDDLKALWQPVQNIIGTINDQCLGEKGGLNYYDAESKYGEIQRFVSPSSCAV